MGLPPTQPLGKDEIIDLVCWPLFEHGDQSEYTHEVQVSGWLNVSVPSNFNSANAYGS